MMASFARYTLQWWRRYYFVKDLKFQYRVLSWDHRHVRTISEDFYSYKITGSLHDNSSDNPFAQPVNVYKNIDNGFAFLPATVNPTSPLGKISERPVIEDITPLKGRPGDHIIITGENFGSGFDYVIFREYHIFLKRLSCVPPTVN